MSIKFTNPWIDRRIEFVRAESAKNYLYRHGWKCTPFPQPQVLRFEGPLADSGNPIVRFVPVLEEADDYVQRIYELITSVAIIEDRTAVEVLNEMLDDGKHETNGHMNGTAAEAVATK